MRDQCLLPTPSAFRLKSVHHFFRCVCIVSLCMASACSGSKEATPALIEPPPGPVRGFRIQIHTTEENEAAHEVAEQAAAWFESLEEDKRRILNGSTKLPVEIKWLQPYYRVRIGHFRTRSEAKNMMERVAERFPAAFIVPDTIQ